MAHGQNAAMKSNRLKEWWGKRPYFGCCFGSNTGNKFYKRCTHKIERQTAKVELKKLPITEN